MEMTADKTAYNPNGTAIFFNERAHRYWSVFPSGQTGPDGDTETVVEYASVTTLLKTCFKKFDEDLVAEQTAARRGLEKEWIIAEWREAGRRACRLGTRVHAVAEDAAMGRRPRHEPESDYERSLMRQAWQEAVRIREAWKILAVEQIVFSTLANVAGQIDLSARDSDGVLWLLDWKTNKEINMSNRYGKKALAPIAHLDDCEFVRYGLQLSLYEWVLRSEGYIKRDASVRRAIIHITPDEPSMIELPDMAFEVGNILVSAAMTPPF